MWDPLYILSLLIGTGLSRNAVNHCNDNVGLMGTNGIATLQHYEYPLSMNPSFMKDAFGGRSACYLLTSGSQYHYQRLGIMEHGEFMSEFCHRRCMHVFKTQEPMCGIRRPSPVWTSDLGAVKMKSFNCSDWDLPLTPKAAQEGVYFVNELNAYSSTFDKGLDDASWNYFKRQNIHSYQLTTAVEDKGSQKQTNNAIRTALQLFENVTNVVLVQYKFPRSVADYKLQLPELVPLLRNLSRLDSLWLTSIDLTDWEQPHEDLSTLKSLVLQECSVKSLPEWIGNAQNLQFLGFSGILEDKLDISVLNNLESLEHFYMDHTHLTSIGPGFLAQSGKLISLTIQDSDLARIEEGAFDDFPQLRFLSLSGNKLTSLPSGLFTKQIHLVSLNLNGRSLDGSSYNAMNYLNDASAYDPEVLDREYAIDKIPDIPAPEKLRALEIAFCKNMTPSLQEGFLHKFKSLEIVNLAALGLDSLESLALSSLCRLKYLLVRDNPLTSQNWLPYDLYTNLDMEALMLGANQISRIPAALIALMRSKMVMMRDISNYLLTASTLTATVDYKCQEGSVKVSTMFGYVNHNVTCDKYTTETLRRVRELDVIKMQTECR